jgi:hypothetical protein
MKFNLALRMARDEAKGVESAQDVYPEHDQGGNTPACSGWDANGKAIGNYGAATCE